MQLQLLGKGAAAGQLNINCCKGSHPRPTRRSNEQAPRADVLGNTDNGVGYTMAVMPDAGNFTAQSEAC
jgi:hypothetical protein